MLHSLKVRVMGVASADDMTIKQKQFVKIHDVSKLEEDIGTMIMKYEYALRHDHVKGGQAHDTEETKLVMKSDAAFIWKVEGLLRGYEACQDEKMA